MKPLAQGCGAIPQGGQAWMTIWLPSQDRLASQGIATPTLEQRPPQSECFTLLVKLTEPPSLLEGTKTHGILGSILRVTVCVDPRLQS